MPVFKCGGFTAMAIEIFKVLGDLIFDLDVEAHGENVSPAEQVIVGDKVGADAVVVGIERGDSLAKIFLEKAAFLDVSMKPEEADVEFVTVIPVS